MSRLAWLKSLKPGSFVATMIAGYRVCVRVEQLKPIIVVRGDGWHVSGGKLDCLTPLAPHELAQIRRARAVEPDCPLSLAFADRETFAEWLTGAVERYHDRREAGECG